MMKKHKGDMEESAHFGQTIRTDSGPDRSSFDYDKTAALAGAETGGGPTDVSHSLSGAGQVKTYNDMPGKKRNNLRGK